MKLWTAIVRFGFRLLYNELAWTYDIVSWLVSFGEWRAWQRTVLQFIEGDAVLEIAHGTGHLLKELNQQGKQVIGMDVSAAMGRLAQARTHGEVGLLRGMAQSLPFTSGQFDTIFTTFPTDFFIQTETLAEVSRVLGENGTFLIVPMGYFKGETVLHRFVDWLFYITGQGRPRSKTQMSQPQNDLFRIFEQRANAVGFSVEVKNVPTKRGGATVLIAKK